MTLIDDRQSGMWNRSVAAGVKPHQVLLSHFIVGTSVMISQIIPFIAYAFYVGSNIYSMRFIVLVTTLLLSVGFTGLLFGLCIAALTSSVLLAANVANPFPLLSLSGKGARKHVQNSGSCRFIFQESFGRWKDSGLCSTSGTSYP